MGYAKLEIAGEWGRTLSAQMEEKIKMEGMLVCMYECVRMCVRAHAHSSALMC